MHYRQLQRDGYDIGFGNASMAIGGKIALNCNRGVEARQSLIQGDYTGFVPSNINRKSLLRNRNEVSDGSFRPKVWKWDAKSRSAHSVKLILKEERYWKRQTIMDRLGILIVRVSDLQFTQKVVYRDHARMSHRKWRENKQQLMWWPELVLLGCCLVSLHFRCDILALIPVQCKSLTLTTRIPSLLMDEEGTVLQLSATLN